VIFSSFGTKLTAESGILQLMDDLGRPLPEGVTPYRLGGGNPARVPAVEAAYRRAMERLLSDGDSFERAISQYDPPQGRLRFIESLAEFFNREYGWNVGPKNIAITNGSQSAFFFLFNLLSGDGPKRRTILFPLVPEYIGYADQGIEPDTFVTLPSRVEILGDHEFKYRLDVDLVRSYMAEHPEVAAICVSRPTNPTGNVLTNGEIAALSDIAQGHGVPLMVDNAYGMPFPDIIFPEYIEGTPAPAWNENTILSMSLSKIGLPALRTGIVVANERIVESLAALNSIVSLASGSLGQVLAEDLVHSGELKRLATNEVQPFYRAKSLAAQEYLHGAMEGRAYMCHRNEGSMFLWLYFDDLASGTRDLYLRLKERGVVVVPGEYFFFGSEKGSGAEIAWKEHPHRHKCVRINYARPEGEVRDGLRIIAEVSASLRR